MLRIFNVVIPARILTLFVAETLAVTLCLLFGAWADPDILDFRSFLQFDSGLQRILLVTGTITGGMFVRNLYSRVRLISRVAFVEELCLVFGATVICQGMIDYAQPQWTIPRKVMILGGLLSMASISGLRLLFDSAAKDDEARSKVLFLGSSPTVNLLASRFLKRPDYGWQVLGYLETHGASQTPVDPGLMRLGTIEDLEDVVNALNPNSIVIARRSDIQPTWTEEFLELRFGGVQVEEAATLYETTLGRVCLEEIWPHRLIFSTFFDPSTVKLKLRVLISLVVATILLLLVAPVMLLIALLVKLGSTGPVLAREKRMGFRDVPFNLHRFRCHDGTGRPTGLGKFLLRFRLDALPELFDVLSGKMSLVGPRPEPVEFAEELARRIPFYRQRHRVKPGLTGWQQIHSRVSNVPDVFEHLEMDLYYVKNLSVSLDAFVMLRALLGAAKGA